jgi:predicted HicB family RNase H-like nuclease
MDNLHYKGYSGSVEYSEADGCLSGSVLGLTTSSITYEGYTPDELKIDFEAGIDSYLEGCKELNVQPENPYQRGKKSKPRRWGILKQKSTVTFADSFSVHFHNVVNEKSIM